VELGSVLIDSGASCNLVVKGTWEKLKAQGVKCSSQKSDKKLFAYGQEKPIETLGTFETEILCKENGRGCRGVFTVVKAEGQPLLCKSTAEALDLLRVGPSVGYHGNINSVTKVKDGDVDIRDKFPGVFSDIGKLKGV
jgi:hypothetical protein